VTNRLVTMTTGTNEAVGVAARSNVAVTTVEAADEQTTSAEVTTR